MTDFSRFQKSLRASKICALKPDILQFPREARHIKETLPNLCRIYVSEEIHGAREKFFLFSCMQIDTYIKHLKHTSVMYCGVGSGCVGGGGIICVRFRELQWCHRVVQNIIIKSGTAGTVLKLKCRVSLVLSRQALPELRQNTF